MIDLLKLLSKFENVNNQENDVAYHLTHVPWVAPLAYLNIIYKPAAPTTLESVSDVMRIPKPWKEFLAATNGARLFSAYLYVYGVVEPGTLLDRSDPFRLPPINLEQTNRGLTLDRQQYLEIASYGQDGSMVCLDRQKNTVSAFHRGSKTAYASWPTCEEWLNLEVKRIAGLFDSRGKLLADGDATLPSRKM
jgi:hypothetical protein